MGYKKPFEAAQIAFPKLDQHTPLETITYQGRYITRGSAQFEKYLPQAEGPCGPREYDGEGFMGFPERQGWDVTHLEKNGDLPDYESFFRQREVEDVAILIQAWLFFGLMGEIFGKRVRVEDFTTLNDDGRKIITLQKFVRNQQWASWADDIRELPVDRRSDRIQAINQSLYMAKEFCKLEGQGILSFIPFAAELASSIRVIGIIIEDVCQQHSDIFTANSRDLNIHGWGMSQLVRDRMLPGATTALKDPLRFIKTIFGDRMSHAITTASGDPLRRIQTVVQDGMPPGWCINDIARLGEYLPATAMYYMSTMPMLKRGENERNLDHSRCSESSCVINSINPETYVSDIAHFVKDAT